MLREFLDFFIFFARHMVLAFLAFLVATSLLGRWTFFRRGLGRLFPHSGRRLVLGLSLAVLVVFAGIGVWYLTLDGFAGEVEPVVTSLSWLVDHGQPLYHDIDAAQRYSVLYGPSVFLTNGLFLQVLGPSLFSAKLASFLGIMGCLAFLYGSLAVSRRDPVALFVTAFAALCFWSEGFAVYLVRPDALLLFSVGLALYAAVKMRPFLAVAAVAVSLGFAVNLKVHAGVYFLPVLALLGMRFGWRRAFLAVVGSVLVIAAPFALHPQISLAHYLEWLGNAVQHGLGTQTLGVTLRFSAYLLLPLATLLLVSPLRTRYLKSHGIVLASLGPAYTLALLVAAKPGAGLVHLLPLVPTTLYLTGMVLRGVVDLQPRTALPERWFTRQGVLVAVALTALLSGSVNIYRAVRLVDWQVCQAPDLVSDVQDIMARYPNISIGMACGGENSSFRYTWLRPLLVFADNPLLVEPIAVMECQLTGRELSPETYRALQEGVVAMWLVPRNQKPFAKENWYPPHDPVFPSRFISFFESMYSPRGHSRYFDLWFWNGLADADGKPALTTSSGKPGEWNLLSP